MDTEYLMDAADNGHCIMDTGLSGTGHCPLDATGYERPAAAATGQPRSAGAQGVCWPLGTGRLH